MVSMTCDAAGGGQAHLARTGVRPNTSTNVMANGAQSYACVHSSVRPFHIVQKLILVLVACLQTG